MLRTVYLAINSLHVLNMIMPLFLFSARLRGVHDGLFTGQIDAVDTLNATYRVTFDRTGLGTHTIPDYEVLVSDILLNLIKMFCSIFVFCAF